MPRERHELRFGKYRTPNYHIGQRVQCAVRGNVRIVGISTPLIPWPLGRKVGKNNRALAVYHGLKRAIAKESAVAVCHWWGVTAQTVKAVGYRRGPTLIESQYRITCFAFYLHGEHLRLRRHD